MGAACRAAQGRSNLQPGVLRGHPGQRGQAGADSHGDARAAAAAASRPRQLPQACGARLAAGQNLIISLAYFSTAQQTVSMLHG